MGKIGSIKDIQIDFDVEPLRCGIPSIERNLYLRRGHGDLFVLAARSGVGKSALANQIAIETAGREEGTVLYFTFELTPEELKKRGISYFSGVAPNKLNVLSKKALRDAEQKLCSRDLAYVKEARNVKELVTMVEEFGFESKVSLVVVDHLQATPALQDGGSRKPSRKDVVGQAVFDLKNMAKKLKVPVLALAQASREFEYRRAQDPKAEPLMSDVSDAADIDWWADVVTILAPRVERSVLAAVVKNRNGRKNSFELEFDGAGSKFIDHSLAISDIKLS